MKLFDALRQSECNAAIYYGIPQVNWAWVVVAWPYSQYSMESHAYYDDTNEIRTIVATFERFPSSALKLKLGDKTYESNRWKPYNYSVVQQQHYDKLKSGIVRNINDIRGEKQNRAATRTTNISGKKFENLFGVDI